MKAKITFKEYLTPLNFTTASYHHSQVVADNKIWCFGGNTSTSNTTPNVKQIRVYDIDNDTWESWTDSNMPTRIKTAGTVFYEGKVWFFGGIVSSSTNSSNIYTYDISTRTWEEVGNLPSATKLRNAMIVGDKIWITSAGSSTTWEFDPESFTFETISFSAIPSGTCKAMVELGGKVYMFQDTSLYIYDIKGKTVATRVFPATVTLNSYAYTIDGNVYCIVPTSGSATTFGGISIYKYDVETDVFTLENDFQETLLMDYGMLYGNTLQVGNKIYMLVKTSTHTIFQPMCISYHTYVVDEEHILETTDKSQVKNVHEIQKVEIIGEEPVGTKLRFGVSFDNRITYYSHNGSDWEVMDKTDVIVKGNTMKELMDLPASEYGKILQAGCNMDFVIGMVTNDEDVSPRLKSISIVKLEK